MKHFFPILILSVTAMSEARDLFEVEPNNTPLTAYDPGFLQNGDRLRGQINGDPEFFDQDYWWLRTDQQEPGIYENRLKISGTGRSFEGSITGLSYDNTVTFTQVTDPNRDVDIFTRWYTFGRVAKINYLVYNFNRFTNQYQTEYEQVRVHPVDLGQFTQGSFRIQEISGNSLVSVIWLDENYNIMPELTQAGTSAVVDLRANLAPGRYTIGIGFGPISADEVDPSDTHFSARRNIGENAVVNGSIPNFDDFQAPLVNFSAGSLTQTLDWRSEVRSRGTHSLAYYQFEVVPEGDAGIALAVGIGALAMTRRRNS